jgi:NADH:ubiquinone oxidoreductase subunit E
MINGSDDIIDYIKQKLNIGVGQTTLMDVYLKNSGMPGRLWLCAHDAVW